MIKKKCTCTVSTLRAITLSYINKLTKRKTTTIDIYIYILLAIK